MGGAAAVIFTYGTLKKGFSNHGLLQDMMSTGDASFLGHHRTVERFPLVCGPYRVPFLLNFPGSGHHVLGELYAVSERGLARMDELEGTDRGHYERLPLKVESAGDEEDVKEWRWVEAYYAHASYAAEMWERSAEAEGAFGSYTEKEAEGYVKRSCRPANLSFLDHIQIYLHSPPC
ncbi:putative gamma-glutamylcyclotransferase At3g02910 [Diospyros lotus]|uniref:putative gamma-glutamylcyclotransferase At3g02910 n=1 Tax=Diospyros lotus TaxID=55363 RepID=UPI0022504F3B|nr:putative gamma-glutamylcyclotransferase At3g02910 [Diospyros lotus]